MPRVERASLAVPVLSAEGEGMDLDQVAGGKVFLWYFSAACSHCQVVAPEVEELRLRLAPLGWRVVGIASSTNRLGEIREFARTFKVTFPLYHDFTRRYAGANEMTSTPIGLLVDAEGKIIKEYRPFQPGALLSVEMEVRTAEGQSPFSAFQPGRYYGASACATCHEMEYRSWGLTHHSIAYQTLYLKENHEDEACVGCHVTGWKVPGGFTSLAQTSFLIDVGCESCHGPGGIHGARNHPPDAPSPWQAPVNYPNVCQECHDPEHSVSFSFARGLPLINHQTAAGLSDEEFQKRLVALASGRAERPLLAFSEGKNLGAEACKGCHETEWQQWKETPHGHAIDSLKRKGATKNTSCLPCHALATTVPPTEPSHFQPGVSCEQCHGPGEKHVASGGAPGTILGLGKSCPVCVIEELCTRCHTPEMDPDWNLDLALPLVRHSPKNPSP